MTETTTRRRAPGVSPERRREMIVAAAVPLVAEYGTAVTTAQIARAAGIGEATIFRVFADKDAVLDACITEVTRADHVIAEIASISMTQPLADRLVEAAAALRAHFDRMGAIIGALHQSGHRGGMRHGGLPVETRGRNRGGEQEGHGGEPPGTGIHDAHHTHHGHGDAEALRNGSAREAATQAVREAVVDLFGPDRDSLRLPAEQVADLLLAQLFTRSRIGGSVPIEQSIDVFLHGALARQA